MNSKKSTNEGTDFGKKIDVSSHASRGPVRSHVWRYRWIYFFLLYLPVAIPPMLTGPILPPDKSFLYGFMGFIYYIAITFTGCLWFFSVLYATGAKKKRWLVAIVLFPPLVFFYFLGDRD